MPDYRVIEVTGKRDLRRFIRFPEDLYRNCPQYVPALRSDQRKSLTTVSTLSYCQRRMWMVLDGDKVAGRICGMINPRYNELYGCRMARFGWFDCIDDPEAARLLISTAEAWAKENGMTGIHGPLYYNTLGKQGMLIEGYGNVPPFNCLYNYPYYNDFMEQLGFVKECDWVQYRIPVEKGVPEKTKRLAGVLSERYGLRELDIDELKKDKAMVRRFFETYNRSFATSVHNFIPFTDEEIEEEAKEMIPFISGKASTILVDGNGEIAAFGISFPSISKALQKAKGKLFPFGWLHLKRAMQDYEVTDLMVNGAAPEWQHKGVSAIYYSIMAEKALKIGNKWAITNPQVETNGAVNIWKSYEREPYMRRRCYIKKII